MLVREREYRNQRAAVLLIAHERRPCPSSKPHPAQKTLSPVIGGILATLIGYQQWREHIVRPQGVSDAVAMTVQEREKRPRRGLGRRLGVVHDVESTSLFQAFDLRYLLGTADQRRQKPVKLLKVHRSPAQMLERLAQAVKLFLG